MYDWIISDTHWNHVNIVEYAGRPANHNELMQQNWRKLVRPDDTVLHLGDVLMGRKELWKTMPGWLPGKVTVIEGNHDHYHKLEFMHDEWGWRINAITGISFSSGPAILNLNYRDYDIIFTHEPFMSVQDSRSTNNTDRVYSRLPEKTINVHGHIHEKPEHDLQRINVSVERIQYQPVNLKLLLDARINLLEKL